MPQGWVSQGRAGPLLHSCSEFRGVKGLPTHPQPTVIQAWQQISWQCAGQSPLFLTHGACGQCHVLWGSYAWVPPSWAQRALIKGEELAGGLGIREAMYTHICMPTHPTVPRLGDRCLCICVHAHCSGWDESGGLCLFDPVYASLRFGGPSCSRSLSRGIGATETILIQL